MSPATRRAWVGAWATASALGAFLASCEFVRAPEGRYACETESDCLLGETCSEHRCVTVELTCVPACDQSHHCVAGTCQPVSGCDASTPDWPDDSFLDTNCDGVDGDAEDAVFVRPSVGDDTHLGTRQSPMKTVAAAVNKAVAMGRTQVYLAADSYPESIDLGAAVSLYGGYVATANWARRADARSTVRGGPLALSVHPPGPLTIERVEVISAAATTSGQPSVGVHVFNTTSLVTLRHLWIHSGDGARGTDGADGGLELNLPDAGRAGPDGLVWDDDGGAFPLAGGGMGGLNWGCGPSMGGGGGAPATTGQRSLRRTDGGEGASLLHCDCAGNNCGLPDGGAPKLTPNPGQPGAISPRGNDGDAGSGLGNLGQLWTSAGGTPGTTGVSGPGGGGGGGGLSSVLFCGPSRRYVFGGGGGGGGSGGCGGSGGRGGQGGGASIGLYLFGSNVVLESVVIATGNGGPGGAGGSGAAGHGGLPGGAGGNAPSGAPGQTSVGAPGGPGGLGGSGGHGGAGGGGPSVGVFCVGGTVQLNAVYVDAGLPGEGGAGFGPPGARGVRCAFHGCPGFACP